MAVVSDIRESRGLMELYLDGVRWLKLKKKHFALLPLELGESIDPEQYLDRQASLQAEDCYEAALTILDQASQTAGGLRAKLCRKGYVKPAAEAVVARLTENRLIDDMHYALRVAQTQLNTPTGAYAIRRKLRAKALPEDVIDAAMEGFDEEQQANACKLAADKLLGKYASLPPREGRAKLSQALARRGFGWEIIRGAIENMNLPYDECDD